MNRHSVFFLSLLIISAIVILKVQRKRDFSDLLKVGNKVDFTYSMDGVSENLTLNADSSFSQVIIANGQSFSVSGKWSYSEHGIYFQPFLARYSNQFNRVQIPPERFSRYEGFFEWNGYYPRIYFDTENENRYFVEGIPAAK